MLSDCHCHLDLKDFDSDRNRVVKERVIVVNNGLNPESNRKTLELAKNPNVKPALGFYPWDAVKSGVKEVEKEIEFISKQKIVAIGEVGLDYYHGKDPKDIELQKEVFTKFLRLAEKMDIPAVVHTRSAESDVLELIKKVKIKIVLHMYTGSLKLVKDFLEIGCYFSIPSLVVRSKSMQELVEKVPIEKILTETDAPYLSHKKGLRNEPKFVKYSIKKIAEIKKISVKECEEKIYSNFKEVFKI